MPDWKGGSPILHEANSPSTAVGRTPAPNARHRSSVTLSARRNPDRHAEAIGDEVCFAPDRIDDDAPVRPVPDTSLAEVRRFAVLVERSTEIEEHRRATQKQWDHEAATACE